jgi:hypothetical protein
MALAVDILQLFPDLAAIDRAQLQSYCHEWLQRPIARECGIAQIIVDDRRNMQVTLDETAAEFHGDHVFVPIDELLGYIVDRHFAEATERRRLHASIRDTRNHWEETGRDYEATVGHIGTLYLVCKNPACAAQLMTDQKATEGQRINCPSFDIECLKCGQTHVYVGDDFKLMLEQ